MESIALEHVPASHTLHLALFRDVRNAAALHAQLLARNPDFEYALIDASIVSLLSPRPPLTGATPSLFPGERRPRFVQCPRITRTRADATTSSSREGRSSRRLTKPSRRSWLARCSRRTCTPRP